MYVKEAVKRRLGTYPSACGRWRWGRPSRTVTTSSSAWAQEEGGSRGGEGGLFWFPLSPGGTAGGRRAGRQWARFPCHGWQCPFHEERAGRRRTRRGHFATGGRESMADNDPQSARELSQFVSEGKGAGWRFGGGGGVVVVGLPRCPSQPCAHVARAFPQGNLRQTRVRPLQGTPAVPLASRKETESSFKKKKIPLLWQNRLQWGS